MIRELTKSSLSFVWALSLLGLKQTVALGKADRQNGSDVFSPVTQMAVGQLGESMQGIYRTGDNIQSRMVDLFFTCMNPTTWLNPGARAGMGAWANPGSWMNPENWMRSVANMTQSGGDCCKQSTDRASVPNASGVDSDSTRDSEAVPGNGKDSNGASGWGPMPTDE